MGSSLADAIQATLAEGTSRGKAMQTLQQLFQQFAQWRDAFSTRSHPEVVQQILEESGYIDMWRKERSIEADGRIENLKEFLQALSDFPTIEDFLDHVSLVMENENNAQEDKVSIMTLHSAKGLEFDTVFLPGWEEGIFPHARALEESGAKGLEEERRLAYVGITRARKRLYICYAANRRIYQQWQSSVPSRFVQELPDAALEHVRIANDLHYYPTRLKEQKPDNSITLTTPTKPSTRVFHQKFGYGTIMAAEGDQLDIVFEKAGRKRILDSFIERVE